MPGDGRVRLDENAGVSALRFGRDDVHLRQVERGSWCGLRSKKPRHLDRRRRSYRRSGEALYFVGAVYGTPWRHLHFAYGLSHVFRNFSCPVYRLVYGIRLGTYTFLEDSLR